MNCDGNYNKFHLFISKQYFLEYMYVYFKAVYTIFKKGKGKKKMGHRSSE